MADQNGNTPDHPNYDPSTEDGSDGPAASDNSQPSAPQPSAPLPADNAPAADTSGQGSDASSSAGSTQYFNGYNPSSGTFGDGSTPGTQPSAPQPAPQPQSNPAQNRSAPQPAQSNLSVGGQNYDTNNQADRATLRQQGYYIDNSGIYAPGSGQRVGSTFSGANASQNVAPSPTQLPIIGGIPVSPSNGETGPQTGAIMYRSDPQYAQYFGPGTPGYSSTTAAGARGNPTLGASGPIAGQGTLMQYDRANGINPELGLQPDASVPAPAGMPTSTTLGPMIPGDTTATPQAQTGAAALSGASPTDQTSSWLQGVQAPSTGANGYGYGPFATADVPQLTSAGAPYTQNGQLIQKSTDQYGNAYYQTVGTAPTAATATTTPPGQTTTPASTDTSDPSHNGTWGPVQIGTGIVWVPNTDLSQIKADQHAAALATAQATAFDQTNRTGQLDINRMVAVQHAAYESSLAQNASATLAQNAAKDALANEIAQQTLALNQQKQTTDVAYQNAQIANAQANTAATSARDVANASYQSGQLANTAQANSLNAQKLMQDRQTARGRSLPMVRYS